MALWKKVLLWILGVPFLLVVLALCTLGYFVSGLCGNDIYQTIMSPDGKLKVVVFERSCGATTDFSTQISLIHSDEDIGNDGGNIFSSDGNPKELRPFVLWDGNSKLNIFVKKEVRIYNQEKKWGWPWETIEISYL